MPLEPIPEEVFNSNLVIKSRALYDPNANLVSRDSSGNERILGPDLAKRHPSAARDPQGTYPRALHKINPHWVEAQKRGEPKTDPKTGQHLFDPKEVQRTLMVQVNDKTEEAAKRKQGWLAHDELAAKGAFDVVPAVPVEQLETI